MNEECLDEAAVLDLAEGRLVGGERRRVERHLDDCAACVELVAHARLALGSGPATDRRAPVLESSNAIDRYVLGPELARGGMGRIVSAHDRRLARDVAIKIALDRDEHTVRRFAREIALTSRLEHPAIVPMHDAGTLDDGTPFYAMRLVGGEPLDRAIAAAASPRERLALVPNVLAVADAMAYVHAHGVIHRDLKPQNILCGEFGETVLLDWGLAKELDDDEPGGEEPAPEGEPGAETTIRGAAIGTPAYMAPEQQRGGAVDPRADVYGLGATLYHVLAGVAPPRARAITAHDLAAMPRELAAIVERATAAEPAARYPSAAELAADLRRFQTGQLVLAYRYSLGHRLRRWIGRNRAAVAIGGVAIVTLGVLSVAGLRQILDERRQANDARAAAETQRDAARDLTAFVLGDLRDRLDRHGRIDILADTSQQVLAYYDKLPASPATVAHVIEALHTQGDARLAAGDGASALAAYERAVALLPQLPADERERTECSLRLGLGDAHRELGHAERSAEVLEAVAVTARERTRAHPDDAAARLCTGKAIAKLAFVVHQRDDNARARTLAAEALALVQPLTTASTIASDARPHMVALKASVDLASWSVEAYDNDAAATHADRALAIARLLAEHRPDDVDVHAAMTGGWNVLGRAREQAGDLAGAATAYEAAYAAAQMLVAREPRNIGFRRNLGVELDSLGRIAMKRGDLPRARTHLQASRDVSAALVELSPRNADLLEELGISEVALGDLVRPSDRPGARRAYERAIDAFTRAIALAPTELRLQTELAVTYGHLAELEQLAGNVTATRAAIERSLALAREVARQTPTPEAQFAVAEKLRFRASVEPARARADLAEALELVAPMRARAAADPYLTEFLTVLDDEARRAGVHAPK